MFAFWIKKPEDPRKFLLELWAEPLTLNTSGIWDCISGMMLWIWYIQNLLEWSQSNVYSAAEVHIYSRLVMNKRKAMLAGVIKCGIPMFCAKSQTLPFRFTLRLCPVLGMQRGQSPIATRGFCSQWGISNVDTEQVLWHRPLNSGKSPARSNLIQGEKWQFSHSVLKIWKFQHPPFPVWKNTGQNFQDRSWNLENCYFFGLISLTKVLDLHLIELVLFLHLSTRTTDLYPDGHCWSWENFWSFTII